MWRNEDNSEILYCFLQGLSVRISKGEVYHLLDTPLGNSLRGISDALDALHINNEVYQFPTEYLNKLNAPFIAVTQSSEDPFYIVHKIEEKYITLTNTHTKTVQINKQAFLQKWTGGVLFAEVTEKTIQDNAYWLKNITYWIKKHSLLLATLIIITLILSNMPNSIGMPVYLCSLFTGFFISSIILYKETIDNRILHRFCHIGKIINCNTVLQSKGSHIKGMGLGELSLLYFTILFLFTLVESDFYAVSIICNIAAIAFTVYSIVYQLFILRKGCMLCMLINLIIWSNWIILYFLRGQFNHIMSFHSLLSFAAISCICLIGWTQIKLLIKANEEKRELKARFTSLLKPETFQTLLSLETQIKVLIKKDITVCNHVTSKNHLTIITNPNCKNCAKIHSDIKEISPYISISLVLLTYPKDIQGEKIAQMIIAAYSTYGWKVAMRLLEEWHQTHQIKKEHRYDITNDALQLWKDQQIYCWQQNIYQTPSIIINDHYLPNIYSLKDLQYVLT